MVDHPERLTSARFIEPSRPIRVLQQSFSEPFGVHWHEFYELGYTRSGRGTHMLNGDPVPLTPGSVFLLTPADFHDLVPGRDGDLEFYNVVFESDVLEPDVRSLLFDRASHGSTALSGTGLVELEHDFARLYRAARTNRIGVGLFLRHLLHCILIEFARKVSTPDGDCTTPVDVGHSRVRAALTYIDHHFREPIHLADAAGHVHLSPNYFSECFRKVTGSSFQRYLQDRRLRFGKALLVSTDLSVTEVCYASGFNNLSHFGRVFKRAFGQTPSSCRELS